MVNYTNRSGDTPISMSTLGNEINVQILQKSGFQIFRFFNYLSRRRRFELGTLIEREGGSATIDLLSSRFFQ
jgi:hypothetical protein